MFECKFDLEGRHETVEVSEICFVRGGFWINSDCEFTMLSDNLFYIMPHMIKEIKKKGTVNNGILRGGKDNE
ncbi:MAG: hypothetical protein GY928_25860 [Colwellia sp.]|nr:hypothetical protein [Colwellia sp.]